MGVSRGTDETVAEDYVRDSEASAPEAPREQLQTA
jgi:hypothetical protein